MVYAGREEAQTNLRRPESAGDPVVLCKSPRLVAGLPWLIDSQLSILFMLASSNLMTQHIWTRIGVAIRYIQDVGAHRRTRRKIPTIADELWNRAAW